MKKEHRVLLILPCVAFPPGGGCCPCRSDLVWRQHSALEGLARSGRSCVVGRIALSRFGKRPNPVVAMDLVYGEKYSRGKSQARSSLACRRHLYRWRCWSCAADAGSYHTPASLRPRATSHLEGVLTAAPLHDSCSKNTSRCLVWGMGAITTGGMLMSWAGRQR